MTRAACRRCVGTVMRRLLYHAGGWLGLRGPPVLATYGRAGSRLSAEDRCSAFDEQVEGGRIHTWDEDEQFGQRPVDG